MTENEAKRLSDVTLAIKRLLDQGPIGPRAASTGNVLTPGDLIDLVWQTIFGKSRKESLGDTASGGAAFVLSVWNGTPIVGWHLNNIPREQIIMVLATAISMIGKRIGSAGIIDDMIIALNALKAHQELEQSTEGQKPN